MTVTIQSGVASTGGAGSSMTLLGTLTTTSGTTQSLTGIAAGYRQLYVEVDGVSFTASVQMTWALSSTNGAAYGTARNLASAASGSAGATVSGNAVVGNISSTIAASRYAYGNVGPTAGSLSMLGNLMDTNTAARVDAIQFAGGTFDAGEIRVYGVK